MKSLGRPYGGAATALVAAMLALGASLCLAQGDGPPAPPPAPPAASHPEDLRIERVYPPRWSWIHWWEANRDPFMKSLRQSGARHDPDPKMVADCRTRAVKALVGGLGSPAPEVRAASALALGPMSENGAVGPLSALAANDGSPKVREMALLALGLADLPEARDFLLTYRYPTDQLMEAGCVGLGLLSAADDPRIVTVLQGAIGSSKPGLAVIGAWGMRQRTDPECLKALKNVLAQSRSPWLASEAILALGERTDAESLPVLTDILLGTEQAGSVAAYRAVVEYDAEIARAIAGAGAPVQQTEPLKALYRKARQWRDLGPNGQGGTAPATAVMRVEK